MFFPLSFSIKRANRQQSCAERQRYYVTVVFRRYFYSVKLLEIEKKGFQRFSIHKLRNWKRASSLKYFLSLNLLLQADAETPWPLLSSVPETSVAIVISVLTTFSTAAVEVVSSIAALFLPATLPRKIRTEQGQLCRRQRRAPAASQSSISVQISAWDEFHYPARLIEGLYWP